MLNDRYVLVLHIVPQIFFIEIYINKFIYLYLYK